MRIDVMYADAAPRVIETTGETMLSGGTLEPVISPYARGGGAVAVMLRPRIDRMCRGLGLSVEVSCWSSNSGTRRVPVSDFGHESEVPLLEYHVVWSWEVLPPDEVARAIAVDIDDRYHVRRLGGVLMDLTAFYQLERTVLSDGESRSNPLCKRVNNVHAAMRRAHPDMSDLAIGNLYGLGTRLYDYAVSMVGKPDEDEGAGKDDKRGRRIRGGRRSRGGKGAVGGFPDPVEGVVDAYGSATSWEEAVGAVASAIADKGITMEALEKACEAHGVATGDLETVWKEAMALING